MLESGFDGEINFFTSHEWHPDTSHKRLIRFLRGKNEHFRKAQENSNHFFWNIETEKLYYINRDKKRFRVEFVYEEEKE